MTPFEEQQPQLNAGVYQHLGDSLSILFADGSADVRLGFLHNDAVEPGIGGTDPIKIRWWVKIDQAALPEGVRAIKRITNPRLDGVYAPSVDTLGTDGNDFVFDLKKARP